MNTLYDPRSLRARVDPDFIRRHGLQEMAPGPPCGSLGLAAEVDGPIAREDCDICGSPREYWPYIHALYGCDRDAGGSYRAFSVCPGCGLEEEF